jgi:hypothetical protein
MDKTQVTTDPNLIYVGKTHTFTLAEIAKISDLKARTGRNESDIVREAVNLLYATYGEVSHE